MEGLDITENGIVWKYWDPYMSRELHRAQGKLKFRNAIQKITHSIYLMAHRWSSLEIDINKSN